jgi:WhiB family redox-sensing transcriptional regulator
MRAGSWWVRAACRGMGPELFFPHGERDDEAAEQIAAAKAVCAGCRVRLHCLVYGLGTNPEGGIWGGLAPTELASMRRARRAARGRYPRRAGAPARRTGTA